MASDYEGEPKEFAVVIPVPTFIERKQIGVVEMKTIDHLDAYTAPRLVEYHDADPCAPYMADGSLGGADATMASAIRWPDAVAYKGVTVEASYDVGEYDVSILSATESDGLVNWLTDNGYKIPAGAEAGARQLHQAEHALLRRQGEPRPHEAARQRLSAAAAGALRHAEIHAAAAARHRERRAVRRT